MKKLDLFLLILPMVMGQYTMAQGDWPRTIVAADGGTIHIFHPQPDSLFDNNIRFSAAFSITGKFGGEPVYGSFQAFGIYGTDKNNRTMTIAGANLSRLDLCVPYDSATKASLRETIECGLPSVTREISLDRVIAMLETTMPAMRDAAPDIDHTPPRIIISSRPSMLVLIDGPPRFKWNKDYGMKVIANSPNTIIGCGDGWFYLYGGRHWYIAPMAEGPYRLTYETSPELQRVMAAVDDINGQEMEHTDTLREGHDVIVELMLSLKPAELLHTLVYGTGCYTPGYSGNGFIPHPWTYGFNMWYSLYTLRPDVAGRIETEDILTDGNGQVFRFDGNGGWLRRAGDHWAPVDGSDNATLARLAAIEHSRQRGTMRVLNFLVAGGGSAACLTVTSLYQFPSYVQTKK